VHIYQQHGSDISIIVRVTWPLGKLVQFSYYSRSHDLTLKSCNQKHQDRCCTYVRCNVSVVIQLWFLEIYRVIDLKKITDFDKTISHFK